MTITSIGQTMTVALVSHMIVIISLNVAVMDHSSTLKIDLMVAQKYYLEMDHTNG